jgi:hypothetical protein
MKRLTTISKRLLFCCAIFTFFCSFLAAQTPAEANNTSQLRGRILDKDNEQAVAEARVELLNFSPPKVVQTDEEGYFNITNIAIGRYRVKVTKEGYASQVFSDLVVSANDAAAVTMPIEPLTEQAMAENNRIQAEKEKDNTLIIYVKTAKDIAANPMSGIAARPFTVEEVTRYAGARFDLARLTNNFAGVSNNYDARNDIVIRGNSPAYLTWQVEELPVLNPNHIQSVGTSGGTTNMISIYALGRADFVKGGFAAQYNNSTAGVFDLQLRQGNSQNFSFLGQIGSQRAEIVAEGPLRGEAYNAGSFMVSVRQSLGSYLYKAVTYNISRQSPAYQRILDWADPEHQDLNFKIHLPKLGKSEVEIFGIAGRAKLYIPQWQGALRDKVRYQIFDNEDFTSTSLVALLGLKYSYRANARTLWRTIVGASTNNTYQDWQSNIPNNQTMTISRQPSYISDDKRQNYSLHSYIQSKPNANLMLKTGLQTNVFNIDLDEYSYLDDIVDVRYKGIFALSSAYAQAKWQPIRKMTIFAGATGQYYSLINRFAAAPRLAAQFDLNMQHSFTLSSSLHQQTQHHYTQFYQPFLDYDSTGAARYHNNGESLGFIQSWHNDLEYRFLINNNWRLKAQAYVQLLSGIAIDRDEATSFSMLNTGQSFFDFYYPRLISTGKGRNMGIELTIEKYFSSNYYLLFTASVFDSKAEGSDGIWRNTVFNNRYIVNLLFGREFAFGKLQQNIFFTDVRFCTRGGRPYTPIDAEATYTQGFQNGGLEEVFIDSLANTVRTPNFYQIDLKVGFRFNNSKQKISHSFRLDIFNVFNINNVLTYRYNAVFDPISGQTSQGQVVPIYQRGFIPDLTYSFQF